MKKTIASLQLDFDNHRANAERTEQMYKDENRKLSARVTQLENELKFEKQNVQLLREDRDAENIRLNLVIAEYKGAANALAQTFSKAFQ